MVAMLEKLQDAPHRFRQSDEETRINCEERSPTPSPLVSVVMLAYMHAPYLRRSIESILRQKTYFTFELVIAEDCSTDQTRAIALEYSQRYPELVRVVYSEANVGLHENLRRAERACRGTYVAYCEGDDYWHAPDKLRKQVGFLESHQEYALVHSNARLEYVESGRLVTNAITLAKELDDGRAFDDILSGRRIIWTVTVCVRRSILDSALADCPECHSNQFLMGDTQRWLEVARRGRVKYFSESLATRQAIPESATRSRSPARILRFALSAKDLLDHYSEKYACAKEVKQAAKMRSTLHVLQCAYAAGDAATAAAVLAECREFGLPITTAARLYHFGSHSPLRGLIARPGIETIRFTKKVARRAARLFSSRTIETDA